MVRHLIRPRAEALLGRNTWRMPLDEAARDELLTALREWATAAGRADTREEA